MVASHFPEGWGKETVTKVLRPGGLNPRWRNTEDVAGIMGPYLEGGEILNRVFPITPFFVPRRIMSRQDFQTGLTPSLSTLHPECHILSRVK